VKLAPSLEFTVRVIRGEGNSAPAHLRNLPYVETPPLLFQVKSSQNLPPQMPHKPKTQNRAPLMRLSGQPALKVRLATSSKRDGNEWAWVVNVIPTAAAVWAERTCEVRMALYKILVLFPELASCALECQSWATPAKAQPAQPPYE